MELLKRIARKVVDHIPYVSGLRREVKAMGAHSAGSYFSPIPDRVEIENHFQARKNGSSLTEIDLRRDGQLEFLGQLAAFYDSMPFSETNGELRYHFGQTCFGAADGILLSSVIRHFKPRRIVELGSGWSSTVILDTLARFPHGPVDVQFVERWPDNLKRLRGRLKPEEAGRVTIIEKKVQDVEPSVFLELQSGDLLFIASSHVIKCGNDLHRILFEILPSLRVGVVVQFHGVHFPFEYPSDWLAQGRYWNESYLLRAFLAFNDSWRILLFNDYVHHEFRDFLIQKMPHCLKQSGSSFYLQRVKGSFSSTRS